MDKNETKCLLGLALANWPGMQDKDFNVEATVTLWYIMLGHLSFELGQAAIKKIIMTSKFFPTISEILIAADSLKPNNGKPPSVEEAWDEVCHNMDIYHPSVWSHDAIKLTVQRLGGIRTLSESQNHAVDRAHFFKLYEIYLSREKDSILNKKIAALVARTSSEID